MIKKIIADAQHVFILLGYGHKHILSLDINELNTYISAREKGHKEIDALNHTLGKYIRAAFNNPKGYPELPYLSKDDRKSKGDPIASFLSQRVRR